MSDKQCNENCPTGHTQYFLKKDLLVKGAKPTSHK